MKKTKTILEARESLAAYLSEFFKRNSYESIYTNLNDMYAALVSSGYFTSCDNDDDRDNRTYYFNTWVNLLEIVGKLKKHDLEDLSDEIDEFLEANSPMSIKDNLGDMFAYLVSSHYFEMATREKRKEYFITYDNLLGLVESLQNFSLVVNE